MNDKMETGFESAVIPRRRVRSSRPVSTAEIVRRLGLTTMTVNLWRQGSVVRRPLPYRVEPRGERHWVQIEERDLVDWLSEYRPDLAERWIQHST